jgi:uncharacterized SAM-binding protein YcdF (DUF218 family)
VTTVRPEVEERDPQPPRHKRRRGLRVALSVIACLIVVFGAVTARLFIWPTQGAPAHASAIVMFEGLDDRLSVAVRLAEQHRAPVLVVSQGREGYGGPCPSPVRGVRLICFDPNPPNTRGEAEFFGRLARQYHWQSVILVTGLEQDTRARMLMSRCFGGPVYVVTTPIGSLAGLPLSVAYEWGAFIKALAQTRSC